MAERGDGHEVSILSGWRCRAGRTRAFECFDGDHPAAATWTLTQGRKSFGLAVRRVARALGRGLGRGEYLSDALDVAGSNRPGEEAVVIMGMASPERHQVPRRDRWRSRIGTSMRTFIRIGIDLAKNFFQVHALEREGALRLRAS